MTFVRLNEVKTIEDVVSGILNCICPECGGRMGGPGREFKCQGTCQRDWRLIWDRLQRSDGHIWRATTTAAVLLRT